MNNLFSEFRESETWSCITEAVYATAALVVPILLPFFIIVMSS